MAIRSLKDCIRRNLYVSVAEVNDSDQWGSAVLAVVMVSSDRRFINKMSLKTVDLIESSRDVALDDYQLGFV